MNRIYTIHTAGYGNDTPAEFVERLHSARINYVLDIRRPDSGSWCSAYRPGYMADLMRNARPFIFYWLLSLHGGLIHFGKEPEESMDDYRSRITDSLHRQVLDGLAVLIRSKRNSAYCIICSEKSHEKCHRTVFAEELLTRLNDTTDGEWVIEHI